MTDPADAAADRHEATDVPPAPAFAGARQVTQGVSGVTLRRAVAAGAAAIVDLRALMFTAMDVAGAGDAGWRTEARAWFERELAGSDTCVVVAEEDGVVVASAMARLRHEAPSPVNPGGVAGVVSNVVTLPPARRRGLARACVVGALDWLRDETPAGVVELFATGDGSRLHEGLGFRQTSYPAMRLRLARDWEPPRRRRPRRSVPRSRALGARPT